MIHLSKQGNSPCCLGKSLHPYTHKSQLRGSPAPSVRRIAQLRRKIPNLEILGSLRSFPDPPLRSRGPSGKSYEAHRGSASEARQAPRLDPGLLCSVVRYPALPFKSCVALRLHRLLYSREPTCGGHVPRRRLVPQSLRFRCSARRLADESALVGRCHTEAASYDPVSHTCCCHTHARYPSSRKWHSCILLRCPCPPTFPAWFETRFSCTEDMMCITSRLPSRGQLAFLLCCPRPIPLVCSVRQVWRLHWLIGTGSARVLASAIGKLAQNTKSSPVVH